jgi:phosphatidylserine/phosphatidylglycerophosphate/cardiolipin synthase-like enzyme
MTADSEWDQAFAELARAGAHIRLYPDDSGALYIHAKAIVADAGRSGQRVLVGSQNFSVSSLGYNRELSIITRNPAVVAGISKVLASADGYSHSYETNGSGYALIYLNGPPAGVRITVTVGGATCSTSG